MSLIHSWAFKCMIEDDLVRQRDMVDPLTKRQQQSVQYYGPHEETLTKPPSPVCLFIDDTDVLGVPRAWKSVGLL